MVSAVFLPCIPASAGVQSSFIVLEECSYEKPYEIARYGHNGSAGDRSNAFSCAMNKARSLQNYSGAKLDYNVYEETA